MDSGCNGWTHRAQPGKIHGDHRAGAGRVENLAGHQSLSAGILENCRSHGHYREVHRSAHRGSYGDSQRGLPWRNLVGRLQHDLPRLNVDQRTRDAIDRNQVAAERHRQRITGCLSGGGGQPGSGNRDQGARRDRLGGVSRIDDRRDQRLCLAARGQHERKEKASNSHVAYPPCYRCVAGVFCRRV
jgi:hypothetical protein